MKFKRTLDTAKQDFPKSVFEFITGKEFKGEVTEVPVERRRRRSAKPVVVWEPDRDRDKED